MPTKCELLTENLREEIRNGHYPFGTRMPSARLLTQQRGASYVTLNKALRTLEGEGWLESRGTRGFFACYPGDTDRPKIRRVNLICQEGYWAEELVFGYGSEQFRNAGWEVFELRPRTLGEVKQALNSPDRYSVVVGYPLEIYRFRATLGYLKERLIVLGVMYDAPFTFVTCDEQQSVDILFQHFRAIGRTRTALLIGNMVSSFTQQNQFASWQRNMRMNGFDLVWTARHAFPCGGYTAISEVEQKMRNCVENIFSSGAIREIDSLISCHPTSALYFIDRCRQLGIRVPDDIAVAVIGTIPDKRCIRELTRVDNDFPGHIDLAREILEARFNGIDLKNNFFTCSAKLIVGPSSTTERKL